MSPFSVDALYVRLVDGSGALTYKCNKILVAGLKKEGRDDEPREEGAASFAGQAGDSGWFNSYIRKNQRLYSP